MRNKKEVTKAINFFKKLKTTLPEHSVFGDPNHLIINAQLDVLEGKLNIDAIDNLDEEEYGMIGVDEITKVYDWLMGKNINIFEE